MEWKTNIMVTIYKKKGDKLVSQLYRNIIIMHKIQNINHSSQQKT